MNIQIATSRHRQCTFGASSGEEDTPYQLLNDAPMKYFFYDEPSLAEPISWYGAFPKLSSTASPKVPYVYDGVVPDFQYTHASLVHVVQAEIYNDDHGASTGVLLRYSDGSTECIGQRQVGLSTTKILQVKLPRRFHFREFEIMTRDCRGFACKRQCIEARFTSDISERLSSKEWHSQDMVGAVTWLFTIRKDVIKLSVQ